MYQHGNVDIRVLKDILGHENLGTTEIYTHLSDEQMANAAQANPLANVKQREPVSYQSIPSKTEQKKEPK
jgi:site-specific recombinase XerC